MNVHIMDANKAADLAGGVPGVIDGPPVMFRALVDTGAQGTMISANVAEKLALRPIGKIQVMGVGGLSEHNNYLFNVGFAIQGPEVEPGVAQITLHVLQTPIQGGELNLAGSGFDVLLGMDVISAGSLAVEGSGTYSFSF